MIAVAACYGLETRWVTPGTGFFVVRTAVGARSPDALDAVRTRNPALLLSTGFCGGVGEHLRLGDLVLASIVGYRGEDILVSPRWLEIARGALERSGHDPNVGRCQTIAFVAGASRKRDLAPSGTLSVDMESGPLAAWARAKSVPFLSLRVVLDVVDEDLPFTVGDSVVSSFLRDPVRSLRAARAAIVAARTLGRALDDLLPALEEGS